LVGGSTGLAGIVIVIWSNLRGWPRDEQRAAFQPTGVVTFLITLIGLGGIGAINFESAELFALGIPALATDTDSDDDPDCCLWVAGPRLRRLEAAPQY
jgi:hypothetical protein